MFKIMSQHYGDICNIFFPDDQIFMKIGNFWANINFALLA